MYCIKRMFRFILLWWGEVIMSSFCKSETKEIALFSKITISQDQIAQQSNV